MKKLFLGILLLASCVLSPVAANSSNVDSLLLGAYLREDMSVWKAHIDKKVDLLYEYGFCGYMVDRDKPNALPYVKRFHRHVEEAREVLPKGHYEMYMSAVYVFELRLKESIHPVRAMSLAKEATKQAPEDPLVLSYYGTCLFYAPKPFGSKQDALEWFEKAESRFQGAQWQYCWVREANEMYINQCKDKLKKK